MAWHQAGVFERLHEILLAKLRAEGLLDTDYAVVDSGSVRAVFGGKSPGPTPRTGPKRARSTTCSRTPAASRWPQRSLVPTATT